MRGADVVRRLLSDPALFSRLVLKMPLYEYQRRPLRAIIASVLHQRGTEFLLLFPRQSGKNEAVSHLLVYLLNILQRVGGNIVFGATGDGLGRGRRRLEERLDNPWNAGHWRRSARPARCVLGKAAVVFLSTHPQTASRGETADWLLVIDEMQEQSASHVEAVFEPMRAAHNATAVYLGTAKTSDDALWLKRQALGVEEKNDGLQRVYEVHPDEVTAENRSYGRFLAAKVRRLGRNHPIVASEYFNQPLDSVGGLFDQRRLELMRGTHRRRRLVAKPGEMWEGPGTMDALLVATLDVAGQDEGATDPKARLANPARDYTVAHVFEVVIRAGEEPAPSYRALDVFVDQGSRHFQETARQPRLADRLLDWLRGWHIRHLVADGSGVGGGLVDWLADRLGSHRVSAYQFTAQRKATLAANFLALVETGRFQYFAGEEQLLSDAWWFFKQCSACRYHLPPGGRFEHDLRWGVPASALVDTPAGRLPVHDDRLISAALVAEYDRLVRQGKVAIGAANSAIIPPADPVSDLRFR